MRKETRVPLTYFAENILLATLIDNPFAISEARRVISTDSFSDEQNGKLWNALLMEYDLGHEVNMAAIMLKADAGHLAKNIIPALPGSLADSAIHDHIYNLHNISLKRKAYFAALSMQTSASGEGTIAETLEIAQKLIDDCNAVLKINEAVKVEKVMQEFGDIVSERAKAYQEGIRQRVPTSFPTLDKITYGGYANGNLVILAARPSIGKTAFMLQMARAASSAFPTLIFSLEMTNSELAQRMAASTGLVDNLDLATGRINWDLFEAAIGKFTDVPLWLEDKVFSLDEICQRIALAHNQGKCGIAFIDYLGLMTVYGFDSRYQEVTEATRRLKRLAKECNIPIVLLCQLNRDKEREERAPQMYDLRDSGSIEQDADIILMLDRDKERETDQQKRKTMLYVRKNRQGETGEICTIFDENFANAYELAKDEYDAI